MKKTKTRPSGSNLSLFMQGKPFFCESTIRVLTYKPNSELGFIMEDKQLIATVCGIDFNGICAKVAGMNSDAEERLEFKDMDFDPSNFPTFK